jgi:hypothetical protein
MRGRPIACQKLVCVGRPGNREQRQNRYDGQGFHARIVVFDCGQKRQSLAHFLDQPEKQSWPQFRHTRPANRVRTKSLFTPCRNDLEESGRIVARHVGAAERLEGTVHRAAFVGVFSKAPFLFPVMRSIGHGQDPVRPARIQVKLESRPNSANYFAIILEEFNVLPQTSVRSEALECWIALPALE